MDKNTEKKLLETVRQNYEIIADHYNETRKKHPSPLWEKLVSYCKSIRPGARVLDVGCGNGRLLGIFDKSNIHYLGVDNNRKLIEHAKSNYPDKNFIIGDVFSLSEIKEKDFDHVFCVAVLHHIPGEKLRVQALRQMKNKLGAEGEIFLTVWNMWSNAWGKKRYRQKICKFSMLKLMGKNKMDFGDILFDWKRPDGKAASRRYYHAFRKRELKRIAKKAGLKIMQAGKDGYNYYMILKKAV